MSDREEHLLSVLRVAAEAQSRLEGALRPLDLTVDGWRVLLTIRAAPGASMADLVEALVIPSSTATRVVDALVERGAVFRTPAPDDRRRVTLRLSAEGLRRLRRAQEAIREIEPPDATEPFPG
ncbi:MarR family transcriptional regulator [Arthrobacter sp. NEB 688]|uniref:MarR family winged helix-turn-helix transcriptional regulator n=1 Tax=Arthrobacter sp. NEB 688 TaxID=904039 RepID=UPI001C20B5CE|nr:MarR family transcriptional regulator [Arthrobacter sp. NEB 688]